jgi:hypothetical protein
MIVDARRSILLSGQVRCTQSFDVIDVVQERGEPLFLVLSCCLPYRSSALGVLSRP